MVGLASFRHAARGLRLVVSRERNAKIHVGAAIVTLGTAFMLRITWLELALVIAMIALVFFAEVVNTAIEKSLDTMATENHQVVKVVKDMTAGGVLVTAIAAVFVAGCIYIPAIMRLLSS
jgi:diacylglycerol kinase